MNEHTLSAKPIKRLSKSLANQIAAGEVVERPASVIKELVENSLDAGAKNIRIDIKRSGFDMLQVTDDGCGIRAQDLALALSSHATSKISNQQELAEIVSLGFRGEALASIASVSQLHLISRTRDDDTAWQLDKTDVASQQQLKPAALAVGTRVTVNQLFYNTPARRKFLRSDRTEYLQLETIFKRLALSRFTVAMRFYHNGREIYRLASAENESAQLRRIAKICGKAFNDQLLRVNQQASGLKLSGWIANTNYSRAQADVQYFYINGRIIRDRTISHAIRSAYADNISLGRFAAYVLFLDIDPTRVDINVHPTKYEVRFHEIRLVHDFLSYVVLQVLQQHKTQNTDCSQLVDESSVNNYPHKLQNYAQQTSIDQHPVINVVNEPAISKNITVEKSKHTIFGNISGIIHNCYIITEYKKGLSIIKISKARAFIRQCKLAQQITKSGVETRPLLIPETIQLQQNRIDELETNILLFERIGIDFSITSPTSVMIRRIPLVFLGCNIKQFILTCNDVVNEKKHNNQLLEILNNICSRLDVDSALTRNQLFSMSNAHQLLNELQAQQNTSLLPDHTDWWCSFSDVELDNLFRNNA